MTLDVIGLAGMVHFEFSKFTRSHSSHLPTGFNYEFNALSSGPKNELSEAFDIIFRSGTTMRITSMIRGLVPALRFLVKSLC